MHRPTSARLGLLAVALIASLLFATGAMAGISIDVDDGCVDPSQGGEAAFDSVPNAGDPGLRRCEQICLDAVRACAKAARAGLSCTKGVNAAQRAAERRACQEVEDREERSACFADVKLDAQEDRTDSREDLESARQTCEQELDDCLVDCNPPA